MRWLVVGANGMLGHDMQKALKDKEVIYLNKNECDITVINVVKKVIKDCDVVVNCAAYTAVDQAEKETELAFKINELGPRNLALTCREIGAKLVHFSTDYVFDGNAKSPYSESHKTNPKSVYGKSKLAGELAVQMELPNNHYIIRTAWLYGKNGNHFGKTILNLAKTKDFLNVVSDQIGQPTWTHDLAELVVKIVDSNIESGIYHGTSSGQVSWFEFAQKIFALAGLDVKRIQPVSSGEFIRPAPRPSYSVLGHHSLVNQGITPIRNWELALNDAFISGVFDV